VSYFNVGLPELYDEEKLDELISNFLEDKAFEYSISFLGTSGEATSQIDNVYITFGLPRGYGVKIKWVQGYSISSLRTRRWHGHIGLRNKGDMVYNGPTPLNRLFVLNITESELITLNDTYQFLNTMQRTSFDLGVRLEYNELFVQFFSAFLDTVAATPTINSTISVGYQLFKYSETELNQLIYNRVS